ncbi:MAG: hypothetical protein AAGU03_08480 [Anaerolineaceae bacterium]
MADTFNFFVTGYVVIFGLLGAYIGWLVLLNRRIKKKISKRRIADNN